MITLTGHPTSVVFALDLSLVVPVLVLAAIWLWKRQSWGYVLAVIANVKDAVYMLALSVTTIATVQAGVLEDLFEPLMRVYNLGQLLPAAQQEQIGKVYISAFLEATLRGESGYQPLFRDHRRARAWLPDTLYISQYQDAATRLLSDYEEDIDLATPTRPGGSQMGENLAIWREQLVVDRAGEAARLPLSHIAFLQPQFKGRIDKADFMSPLPQSEPVFQHFEFPLADFVAVNPAFDPTGLAQVRFIFDRTRAGVVALDDVGLR